MKTWRKALRRLVKNHQDGLAARYPDKYRRLTPKELSELTKTTWEEVGSKLTAVPTNLLVSMTNVPTGRKAVWSMRLMAAVVQ